MKNKVLGLLAVLWGGAMLARHFLGDSELMENAYQAGQFAGLAFGAVLVLAGLYALLRKPKKA